MPYLLGLLKELVIYIIIILRNYKMIDLIRIQLFCTLCKIEIFR